jgi:rubrerythrin
MNKKILLCAALFTGIFLTSIAGGTEKTIANLKSAFKGELNASVKYSAYAGQAKKEGLFRIANMFEATSRAAQIHANNFKTVLEKLGQKPDLINPVVTPKSTSENLEDAIKGETNKRISMYPEYIATAKAEDAAGAAKAFRWAMETEKQRVAMYQKALTAMNAKKTESLPNVYWVCPKCGNTYDQVKPEATCSYCSTKRDKFIKFTGR